MLRPEAVGPGLVKRDGDIVYECEVCACVHPWTWDGDCRDDANRYADEYEYAEAMGLENVEVRSMEDRVQADLRGEL